MHSETARAQVAAFRAPSVEHRLRVAESLRTFAWQLKPSVIAQRHPERSDAEVAARGEPRMGS
jgi:hypothetical protein